MEKYVFLEDVAIADIAYDAYGKSYDELFYNSALALFECSAELDKVEKKKEKKIKLENEDIEKLLFDFLNEIVYIKDVDYMIFKDLDVKILKKDNNFVLKATLYGEGIDMEKHELGNDIKAVTYHQFKIYEEKNGYRARIVIDI